ncbi:MAG: hypothetical protein ACI9GK_001554, partial [Devosia sp.]
MTMAGRPAAGQYGAMNQTAFANRRQVLAGAIVLAAGAPISAHAQSVLEPST